MGVVPAQVEQRVLVDQVGQTVSAVLPVCLQPGPVAFVGDELVEEAGEGGHRVAVEYPG